MSGGEGERERVEIRELAAQRGSSGVTNKDHRQCVSL